MHRFLCSLAAITLFSLMLCGQEKPAAKPDPRPAEAPQLPSRATVESFLQHTFGYDPDLRWTIGEIMSSSVPGVAVVPVGLLEGGEQKTMVFYVTPDQQHAFVGDLLPFGADPYLRARKLLKERATGPARGPADATLTIVEFGDLECPHCKAAQPVIEKLLTDFPNTKLIFQQFPITALHPWAFKAAAWAECVAQQSPPGFWKFVQGVYDDQLEIGERTVDAKLPEHATRAGVDATVVSSCVANPETTKRVNASLELGHTLEVTSTPTLFINGRGIEGLTGIPYDLLKTIVQFQVTQGK